MSFDPVLAGLILDKADWKTGKLGISDVRGFMTHASYGDRGCAYQEGGGGHRGSTRSDDLLLTSDTLWDVIRDHSIDSYMRVQRYSNSEANVYCLSGCGALYRIQSLIL